MKQREGLDFGRLDSSRFAVLRWLKKRIKKHLFDLSRTIDLQVVAVVINWTLLGSKSLHSLSNPPNARLASYCEQQLSRAVKIIAPPCIDGVFGRAFFLDYFSRKVHYWIERGGALRTI